MITTRKSFIHKINNMINGFFNMSKKKFMLIAASMFVSFSIAVF